MAEAVALWRACEGAAATLRDATTASDDDGALRAAVWPTTVRQPMNDYHVLTEMEWQRLLAAGLQPAPAGHDKELYCFRDVPGFDGFRVRVLRLVQELESGGTRSGCSPPPSMGKGIDDPGTAWTITDPQRKTVEQSHEIVPENPVTPASIPPPRPTSGPKEIGISPTQFRGKRPHKDDENGDDSSPRRFLKVVEPPSKARRVNGRRGARKACVLPPLVETKDSRSPDDQDNTPPASFPSPSAPSSSSSRVALVESPRGSEVSCDSGSFTDESTAWDSDSTGQQSAKTTSRRENRRLSSASESRRMVTRSMAARSRQLQADRSHRELDAAAANIVAASAGDGPENNQHNHIKTEHDAGGEVNGSSEDAHEGHAGGETTEEEDEDHETQEPDQNKEHKAQEDAASGSDMGTSRASGTQQGDNSIGTPSAVWAAMRLTPTQLFGVLRGAQWLSSSIAASTPADFAGALDLPEWDDDGGIWASLGLFDQSIGHGGLVVRTRRQCMETRSLRAAWGF